MRHNTHNTHTTHTHTHTPHTHSHAHTTHTRTQHTHTRTHHTHTHTHTPHTQSTTQIKSFVTHAVVSSDQTNQYTQDRESEMKHSHCSSEIEKRKTMLK